MLGPQKLESKLPPLAHARGKLFPASENAPSGVGCEEHLSQREQLKPQQGWQLPVGGPLTWFFLWTIQASTAQVLTWASVTVMFDPIPVCVCLAVGGPDRVLRRQKQPEPCFLALAKCAKAGGQVHTFAPLLLS